MTEGRGIAEETENAVCASCRRRFWCGADLDHCWCDDVLVTPEQREKLAASGLQGCLCPDCLQNLEA